MIRNETSHRRTGIRFLAVAAALWASAAFAKWEKLENCVLETSEYMDGDSFHVRHANDEFIFRLYFVDAPETDSSLKARIADQAAYWGIPEIRIPKIGRKAHNLSLQVLRGKKFTVYTKWQDAEGASALPRYFGVVKIGNDDLAELLIEEGLARVYGASEDLPDGTSVDAFFQQLRGLENRAKAKHRGVWSRIDDTATEEAQAAAEDLGDDTNEVVEINVKAIQWPNVPIVAFLRAEAFVNLERFEEAEVEMAELLERFPEHPQKPRIEFYLALSQAMQEKFTDAISNFESWLSEYPGNPMVSEVEYWLPISMFYDGQYDKARPLFEQFAAKNPMSIYAPEAEYRAAICRYAVEDFKGSALSLGAWIEKHPDHYFHWEAQVTRGDALAAMGLLEQARDNYLRVTVEGGAFYFLSLTQLAKVYKALGAEKDFKDMASAFARFIKDKPDSDNLVDAAYQAGWALRQIGRADEARKLYWGILDRFGNNNKWEGFQLILKDLSSLYPDQPGQFEVDVMTRAEAAIAARRMTLASRLALAQIENENPSNLLAAAQAFAERFQGDYLGSEALAFLGEAFAQNGHTAKAAPYFASLLARYPDSLSLPLAYTRLAEQALRVNDFTGALANAEAAIERTGEPVLLMEATFTRARSFEALGRYGEAVKDYNAVIANRAAPRPLKPVAMLGVGSCLEAEGKLKEAIPYYQRIYVMYQAYTEAVAQAYLKSGQLFEKLNDMQAAANTYQEMLGLESMNGRPEAATARQRLLKLGV